MKLRRLARVTFDHAASASGWLRLAEHRMRSCLTVLTFHRVLPDEHFRSHLFPSLAVSESMFRGQMRTLSRRFDVVTLQEGAEALRGRPTRARPMVAVTFDDGYADNVNVAAPIMKEFGVRGTFFVVAGFIGTDSELWYDVAARRWQHAQPSDLARACRAGGVDASWMSGKPPIGEWMSFLKHMLPVQRANVVAALADPGRQESRRHLDRMMTPDELRALHAAGHGIGSHSMSHPLLPQLDSQQLEAELVQSRAQLEQWLHAPVLGFSYPNGDQDDRVRAAVAHAGCTYACVTATGHNHWDADPLRLRRIDMHPSRSAGLHDEFDEPSFRASLALIHSFHRTP